MSQPIIQTRALTEIFGQRTAVDRLNPEVMPGDVFGFLGPNSAGKTTTIFNFRRIMKNPLSMIET